MPLMVTEVSPDGFWFLVNNEWKTKEQVAEMGAIMPGQAPPAPPAPVAPAMPAAGPVAPVAPTMPVAGPVAPITTPPGFTQVTPAPAPAAPVAPVAPVAPAAAPMVAPMTAPMAPMAMPAAPMAMPGATVAAPSPTVEANFSIRDIDITGIQDRSFRILPPEIPEFEGKIMSAKKGIMGTDFKPYVGIEVVTTYPEGYEGVTIYNNVMLTGKALARWKSLCRSCDVLNEQGGYNGDEELQCLVGKIIGFGVKTGADQQGQPRNDMKWDFWAGYRSPEVADQVGQTAAMASAPVAAPIAQPTQQTYIDPNTNITYVRGSDAEEWRVSHWIDTNGKKYVVGADGTWVHA